MGELEVSSRDRVGYLRLNRPDKLNALSPTMLDELIEGLDRFEADPAVRVVVICGAGRAFSSGGDMSGPGRAARPASQRSAYEDWEKSRHSMNRWLRIWDSPMPVIAAVQGYCMGTATVLAGFCDLTVVAEDAIIGWPQLPVGGGLLSPVAMWFLGPKKARELSYLAGSRFSGAEAVALGWANMVVPTEDLADRVHDLAARIARTPADVLAVKKRALNRMMDIQGFRTAVQAGAEFGAISHQAPGAEYISRVRKERGMKETIAAFQRGEINVDELEASDDGG